MVYGSMQMTAASRTQLLVVGIGGTTRANSSSQKALHVALQAAEAAGAETILVTGAQLQFPIYEPSETTRTEDASRFIDLLRRSQGLVIASPGYHGSISGLIKNALDYIEDLRDSDPPYLDGRAVGCIACALGWQAAGTTLVAMRSIVHALRGWPTPMGAAINSALPLFDDNGTCADSSAKFQLELIGQQVVEFARMRANACPDDELGRDLEKRSAAR
jgi:FMN reductase